MARPGRLELPTLCLEGRRSIQLSYGRILGYSLILLKLQHQFDNRLVRNLGAFGALGEFGASDASIETQWELEPLP
jgi:hypothetical protein